MLRKLRKLTVRILPLIAAWCLATYLTPTVVDLAQYQDSQIALYDAAMQSVADNDPDGLALAPKLLEQSAGIYKQNQDYSWWDRFYYPVPDQEVAALAYFHQGNLLRANKKYQDALTAYVQSLRLNSGQGLLPGVSARDDPMHLYGRDFCVDPADQVGQVDPPSSEACQVLRLEKEADDTRNNLISLINDHPELAQSLANPQALVPGGGQAGQGHPSANNLGPGQQSAAQVGHGQNNAI
jgi:tetratricopeptide (TPR) repeat protein